MGGRHAARAIPVLIVVDGHAIDGQKIAPIADNIAMLALSVVKQADGCSVLPRILDLLAAKCTDRPAPETWTKADIAYLSGLYSMDLQTAFTVERDTIVSRMVEDLPDERAVGRQ
jgi:hypothetical protein